MYISVSFFHRGELFIVRNCEQIRDFYFISIVKSMEVGEEIQNDRRRNIIGKNIGKMFNVKQVINKIDEVN